VGWFLWKPFSSIVKMEIDQQLEQRINITFLVKLGKNGPETHQMLQQVYGEGQTVNAAFYLEVLKRLRDRVPRVRPELWEGSRWILNHENAPAHSALVVREFFEGNSITELEHPHKLPDLASCDFFLFPKCKLVLRGGIWGM